VKREYKKKVNICEGEKDYKKWMAKLKTVKNTSGKMIIDRIDQTICSMIMQHQNKLLQQGIDVAASVPAEETVNVPDSNNEKDYVNLETVGIETVSIGVCQSGNSWHLCETIPKP